LGLVPFEQAGQSPIRHKHLMLATRQWVKLEIAQPTGAVIAGDRSRSPIGATITFLL
jgi:hypothetical protein